MRWLAIDIGGANLKLADGQGFAESRFFPLWQRPSKLEQELRLLIAQAPPSDHVVATMTGELADCYASKEDGVRHILDAFVKAVDQRHARVYRLDGKIVTPQVALSDPLRCAAANWHALARFAGRFAMHGSAIMIDVGSTTSDVIALKDGVPAPIGTTDTGRLLSGELVYTGVGRSPICALLNEVAYRGQRCPVAQEVFATTLDVYLTLGDLPDEPTNNVTADGRPATRDYARGRLARLICADRPQFVEADAMTVAREAAHAQLLMIAGGMNQVLAGISPPPLAAVVSGQGEFLARRALGHAALNCKVVSLSDRLGPRVSRCATAHALAVLASEV